MATNYNVVLAEWKDESALNFFMCKSWATGGTVTTHNAGNLNLPVNDLLGNTKYLYNILLPFRDEYLLHLTDVNAHVAAFSSFVDARLSAWAIPPSKIKASLNEQAGITDDDVEVGADIKESKILLDIEGKVRPPISRTSTATYSSTEQLGEDISRLFTRLMGTYAAYDIGSSWGKANTPSGWLVDLQKPQTGFLTPGSLSIQRNRLVFVHGGEMPSVPNGIVGGVPVRVGGCYDAGSQDNYESFMYYPAKSVVYECGVEATAVPQVSAPGMYDKGNGVPPDTLVRRDTVFLEVWNDRIDRTKGYIMPFGNVQYAGTLLLVTNQEFDHTEKYVSLDQAGSDVMLSNSAHQCENDQYGDLHQRRYRIRVEIGKDGIVECHPQAYFQASLDTLIDQSAYWYSDVLENSLILSGGNRFRTGNPVRITNGGSVPYGLEEGTTYFVCVSSQTEIEQQIWLAETFDAAVSRDAARMVVIAPGTGYNFAMYAALVPVPNLPVSAVEDLFTNYVPTPVGSPWVSGLSAKLILPSDLVSVSAPNFGTYDYFVKPVGGGWVEIYQHENPWDVTTAMKQVAFEELSAGKMTLSDVGDDRISEDIYLDDYTVDIRAGKVRSVKPWSDMQKVKISVSSCRTYIHTSDGFFDETLTYFVSAKKDELGVYQGLVLCSNYDFAKKGVPIVLLGYRLAGSIHLEYPATYCRRSGDAGLWWADIPVLDGGEGLALYSQAIPIAVVHRRNVGIYHPYYNPNGTARAVDLNLISSVVDCFAYSNTVVYCPENKKTDVLSASPIDPENPDFIEIDGDVYFRSGYSGSLQDTDHNIVGVSGRPDGAFYDILLPSDVIDQRHQVSMAGTDLNSVLGKNLDMLFRGVLNGTGFEQRLVGGGISGIIGTEIQQVDLLCCEAPVPSTSAGTVIDRRKKTKEDDVILFSWDHLDGLRRVWSDAPTIQAETDILVFGTSLMETPPEFRNIGNDSEVGIRHVVNFSSSARFRPTVSPGGILDIDYEVVKYRSFTGGPVGVNKLAMTKVKIARGSIASGDYQGAEQGNQDTRRIVRFEAASDLVEYKVFKSVDGSESFTVDSVDLLNDGRCVEINLNAFQIPSPLRGFETYRLFPHPTLSGWAQFTSSLAASVEEQPISMVIDRSLVDPSITDSTLKIVQGICPLQSSYVFEVVEGDSFLVGEGTITVPVRYEVGAPVLVRGLTSDLPSGLDINTTYFLSPSSVSDGELGTLYSYRLSRTKSDAEQGLTIEFGSYSGVAGSAFVLIDRASYFDGSYDYQHIIRGNGHQVRFSSEDVLESVVPGDFASAVTGTPVFVVAGSGVEVDDTWEKGHVYSLVAVDDSHIKIAYSAEDALNGIGRKVNTIQKYPIRIYPVVPYVTFSFERSDMLFTMQSDRWRTGTEIKLRHNVPDPIDPALGLVEGTGYFTVLNDSTHLKLASSLQNAIDGILVGSVPTNSGSLHFDPTTTGLYMTVVRNIAGELIFTDEFGFPWQTGFKIQVTGGAHSIPQGLIEGMYYYVIPLSDNTLKLAVSYDDAMGGNSVTFVAELGDVVQFAGFPVLMESGNSTGKFTIGVSPSTPIQIGSAVMLDYYSDVPMYTGAGIPPGFSTGTVYYVSSFESGKVTLAGTVADTVGVDVVAIVPQSPPFRDFYGALRPLSSSEVSYYLAEQRTDYAVSVTDHKFQILPVKMYGIKSSEFPIMSGIRQGETVYAVSREDGRVKFANALSSAIDVLRTGRIALSENGANQGAYLDLVPLPLGDLDDPVLAEILDTQTADPSANSIRCGKLWLTGTPVLVSGTGSLGPESEQGCVRIGAWYFVCVRKVVDPNYPTEEIVFADIPEASYAYDGNVKILSVGSGQIRLVPQNLPEVLSTGTSREVIVNSWPDPSLRNTIQFGKTWMTGTPIRVENVGEGSLPQYTVLNPPSNLGTVYEISMVDFDPNDSSFGDNPVTMLNNLPIKVISIGDDIPSGLDRDLVYFVSSASPVRIGYVGIPPLPDYRMQFKLAGSFSEAMVGGGVDILSVESGKQLSISPCFGPESEVVNLGAGAIDLSQNFIYVDSFWPTGIPVSTSIREGGILPIGLSTDCIYFSHTYAQGKIRLVRDLSSYYKYITGQSALGSSMVELIPGGEPNERLLDVPPVILRLNISDDGGSTYEERYHSDLVGGKQVRIYVSEENSTEEPESTLYYSRIDQIRFGSQIVYPPLDPDTFQRLPYFEVFGTDEGNKYVVAVIPPYTHDATTELAIRKRVTDDLVLWSTPKSFAYTSTAAPVLHSITPTSITDRWNVADSPEIQATFSGKIVVTAFFPQTYTLDDFVVKFAYTYDSARAVLQGGSEILIGGEDVSIIPAVGTPFCNIEIAYTAPVFYTKSATDLFPIVLNAEVSFVTNDSNRIPVSLNTLKLTQFGNVNMVDSKYTYPMILAVSAPRLFDVPTLPKLDLCWGYQDRDSYVRLVTLGYAGNPLSVIFEDPITGIQETRVAYVSWEPYRSTQTSSLYVKVPPRFTGYGQILVYLEDYPDNKVMVSFRESYAPFVLQVPSSPLRGGTETVFYGSGLSTVSKVIAHNGMGSTSDFLAINKVAKIIHRSDTDVGVVTPPITSYDPHLGDTPKVSIYFCTSSGSCETELVYSKVEEQGYWIPPLPSISSVDPPFVLYTAAGGLWPWSVEGGSVLVLEGANLHDVVSVTLSKDWGELGVHTVTVTELHTDATHVWFVLPDITPPLPSEGAMYIPLGGTFSYNVNVINSNGDVAEESTLTLLFSNSPGTLVTQRPIIQSITPDRSDGETELQVVLQGTNFAGAACVMFGTQRIVQGRFTVVQGSGQVLDTIQFMADMTGQSGMVPITVMIQYGQSGSYAYCSSDPMYFDVRGKYYVEFGSEGVGEMTISARSFDVQQIDPGLPNKVIKSRSLIEVGQDIPTGTPIRFSGDVLPASIVPGKVYYAVASDLRRIHLKRYNTGDIDPVDLSAPFLSGGGSSCYIVDLPTIPSQEDPTVRVVDWSENILRYVETVELSPDTIDSDKNTLLLNGSYWSTDKVVTFNTYDPLFFMGSRVLHFMAANIDTSTNRITVGKRVPSGSLVRLVLRPGATSPMTTTSGETVSTFGNVNVVEATLGSIMGSWAVGAPLRFSGLDLPVGLEAGIPYTVVSLVDEKLRVSRVSESYTIDIHADTDVDPLSNEIKGLGIIRQWTVYEKFVFSISVGGSFPTVLRMGEITPTSLESNVTYGVARESMLSRMKIYDTRDTVSLVFDDAHVNIVPDTIWIGTGAGAVIPTETAITFMCYPPSLLPGGLLDTTTYYAKCAVDMGTGKVYLSAYASVYDIQHSLPPVHITGAGSGVGFLNPTLQIQIEGTGMLTLTKIQELRSSGSGDINVAEPCQLIYSETVSLPGAITSGDSTISVSSDWPAATVIRFVGNDLPEFTGGKISEQQWYHVLAYNVEPGKIRISDTAYGAFLPLISSGSGYMTICRVEDFFASNPDNGSFKVSRTNGGSPLNISNAGSGEMRAIFVPLGRTSYQTPYIGDPMTEQVTLDSEHIDIYIGDIKVTNSWTIGTRVWVRIETPTGSSGLPVPFTTETDFFIRSCTGTDPKYITLSRTRGGSAVVPSTTGSGTMRIGPPEVTAYPNWRPSSWDPSLDPDREFKIAFPETRTWFIRVAETLTDAVGVNPRCVSLADDSEFQFDIEVVNDRRSEVFESNQIMPSLDLIQSNIVEVANCPWHSGMAVRLGTLLPDPMKTEKVYYSRVIAGKLYLSAGMEGTPSGSAPMLFTGNPYGVAWFEVTYPELTREVPYYVEDVGGGRARIAETPGDLYSGNFIKLMIGNDTQMRVSSWHSLSVVDCSSVSVDVQYGEIVVPDADLITLSPIKLEKVGDAVLPSGLNEDDVYYVYRVSSDSIRLLSRWDFAAILGSHIMRIKDPSGTVTLNQRFLGSRISLNPVDNMIDYVNNAVNVNVSGMDGVPVRISSDVPSVPQAWMQNAMQQLRVKFFMKYPGGEGLSDSPIRREFELGEELPRLGIRTPGDVYFVRDPRFSSVSRSGVPYWDSTIVRDVETSDSDRIDKSEADLYTLLDGWVPGGYSLGHLEPDDTTVDLKNEASYEFAYDEVLSSEMRGLDVYIAAMVIRVDWIDDDGYQQHAVVGEIPYQGEPQDVNQFESVFDRITVTWDRVNRKIVFGKKEDCFLTFRVGFVDIDRSSVPTDKGQTNFSGMYDVGSVWSGSAETRSVMLVSQKRIIQKSNSSGFAGWDSASKKYSDPRGTTRVVWVGDPAVTMWLAYASATVDIGEGAKELMFDTGLEGQQNAFFQDGGGLGDVVDTFYYAGDAWNPRPVTAVDPIDAKHVQVSYVRKPRRFDVVKSRMEKLLPDARTISSLAGSGTASPQGNAQDIEQAYPYLLSRVLTPFNLSEYNKAGIVVSEGGTRRREVVDVTFMPASVCSMSGSSFVGPVDKRRDMRRTMFSGKTSQDSVDPFFLNAEGTEVLHVRRSGDRIVTDPELVPIGSRMVTLLPNLVLENEEIKGLIVVSDSDTSFTLTFPLDNMPLLRPFAM